MRVVLILLTFTVLIGFSCKKTEDPGLTFEEQYSLDSAAIEAYIQANGITNVVKDRTGYLNYVLHEEGDGVTPFLTDSVEVSYSGRLLDADEDFESGEHIEFRVNGLITGWQIILTEMQEGDSVTMFIPSGYAYGKNGSGDKIPANANLIFELRLHRVFQ